MANALLIRVCKNERWHELVGLAKFILSIQGIGRRRFADFATAENNRVPSLFRSVPATVAIHREVTTDDRYDLRAALLQLILANLQIVCATGRRSVATVGESVNEDFSNACFLGCVCQRNQVRVMAVHTASGNEAEQMQSVTTRAGERFLRASVTLQFALRDSFVNSG